MITSLQLAKYLHYEDIVEIEKKKILQMLVTNLTQCTLMPASKNFLKGMAMTEDCLFLLSIQSTHFIPLIPYPPSP